VRRWIGLFVYLVVLVAFFIPSILEPVLQFFFPGANEWIFPRESLIKLTTEHLLLSLLAGAVAAVIGMGLGIAATRRAGRPFLTLIRDVSSLAQTMPPAAVLALAIPFLGFGFKPVLLALVCYSTLPVLNNTLAAIENLPRPVLEAARGIGMSRLQVLLQIELPLALPVIGTGIRICVVINVGTATIGALAGAGGLGSVIVAGLTRNNPAWVFQGAIASASLALMLNSLLLAAEHGLQPAILRNHIDGNSALSA